MEFVLSQNEFVFDTIVFYIGSATALKWERSLHLRFLIFTSMDDIIMLWDYSLFELVDFLSSLNSYMECIYPNLVLTKGPRFQMNRFSIPLYIYSKNTNKFMYIPYQSSHLIGVKKIDHNR